MIVKRRRIFVIATLLLVTAIVVVLCVGYFTEDKKIQYDGTLVKIEKVELAEKVIKC